MVNKIQNLKIQFYVDGAYIKDIIAGNKNRQIKGFTTNPSLMKARIQY